MFGSNQNNATPGFGFGSNTNQGTGAFGSTNPGGAFGTNNTTGGKSSTKASSDSIAFGGGGGTGGFGQQRPNTGMHSSFAFAVWSRLRDYFVNSV